MTSYKQRHHSLIGNVDKIVAGLPSLEKVVVIPFDGNNAEVSRFSCHQKILSWEQMKELAGSSPVLSFEQVPFDHPLFILFSSGTTGIPKGMVHTVGVRLDIFNNRNYHIYIYGILGNFIKTCGRTYYSR
jgi:acetoacetyl-CoA synthetase